MLIQQKDRLSNVKESNIEDAISETNSDNQE